MSVAVFQDLPDEFQEPICWDDIECAIHEWVTETLNLGEDRAIWENQNIPQPSYPYVSLLKSGPRMFGRDEVRVQTDLGAALGEETELRTQGPREFTLTVQVHVGSLDGEDCPGPGDPMADAIALMSRLQAM